MEVLTLFIRQENSALLDILMSIMGTFIGAGLAFLVALYIFRRGQKEKTKEKNDEIFNKYCLALSELDYIIELSNEFKGHLLSTFYGNINEFKKVLGGKIFNQLNQYENKETEINRKFYKLFYPLFKQIQFSKMKIRPAKFFYYFNDTYLSSIFTSLTVYDKSIFYSIHKIDKIITLFNNYLKICWEEYKDVTDHNREFIGMFNFYYFSMFLFLGELEFHVQKMVKGIIDESKTISKKSLVYDYIKENSKYLDEFMRFIKNNNVFKE